MFGLADLISLIISAFIILPIVVFLRESGYLIVSAVFGVNNPRLTIGSGPRIVKVGMFDIRKYYHLYSWYSYDSLKRKSKFVYVSIYAGPILVNLIVALTINAMLANDLLQEYETFWSRFVFYAFYYVLFDIVPMKTANGMPNNGLIIYEMLRYGRRTDYNQEPFIPSTSEVEEQYQEEMEKIEEVKEQQKDQIEHEKQEEKQELKEQKAHEKEKAEEHRKERKQ
ncbi:hypothetical protein QWY22_01645 [Planococcus liqunii]|uniref:Uncharacterized protein n=1 Tax=Planococcus liqunii TaxID=3058394 RepID=A0ABT8MVK2_9BACL|nr:MULTISPECIES: hypothetical protein [unclassified Planococcus (in: firmicutes)]MDN7228909.1 hypothetical protein [Planococcus sp. N064]WKA51337.1 hypothetical protein QWY22_01645 [Planococcus sp. N056]